MAPTDCNRLQQTVTDCNTRERPTLKKKRLRGVNGASTLQHIFNVLQRTATRYNTMQHTVTPCNVRERPRLSKSRHQDVNGTVRFPAGTARAGLEGVALKELGDEGVM